MSATPSDVINAMQDLHIGGCRAWSAAAMFVRTFWRAARVRCGRSSRTAIDSKRLDAVEGIDGRVAVRETRRTGSALPAASVKPPVRNETSASVSHFGAILLIVGRVQREAAELAVARDVDVHAEPVAAPVAAERAGCRSGCPHSIRRRSIRSNSTDSNPASCGGVATDPTISVTAWL